MLFCCLFCLLALAGPARAADGTLDFTTIKLGTGQRVVLVIGGIQGDEPGGFSAATLLATRYEIEAGAVWVVPNLNFPSIIERSRGVHGDMNRKFARLDEKDPEYATVARIKELICHPQVALVLNLHDGSGYYRPVHENSLCNPRRWGQSVIIDQESLPDAVPLNHLGALARTVVEGANAHLIKPLHKLHVHNTHTAAGDKEMEKSLSYYAVQQGKAAFGVEASKEFSVPLRTYYHLQMLEVFLREAGVRFKRDFELTPRGVEKALHSNLGVAFEGNRVFLPLEDVCPAVNYLPLTRESARTAVTSKPIMAALPCKNNQNAICLHYGNRTMTIIKPEWRQMDHSIEGLPVTLDGAQGMALFGRVLDVHEGVTIHGREGYRVNAIGLNSGRRDESDMLLHKKQFEPRFSVDRRGTMFRVEVYKGQKFCGLFLLRFHQKKPRS